MQQQTLYLWKQAPFLRLLLPFIGGILLQWYLRWLPGPAWLILAVSISWLVIFNRRPSFVQYRLLWLNGFFIHALLLAAGWLIMHYRYAPSGEDWFGHYYHEKDAVTVILEDAPARKNNKASAEASVQQVFHNDSLSAVSGRIIIYFTPDSSLSSLGYGSRIVFTQPLQELRQEGSNPGSFNYARYAALRGIYHQVFLRPGAYTVLPGRQQDPLKRLLLAIREKVLRALTRYIPGSREAGLAEALLAGYKDNLDKALLQSYSNTGVVHIIAISGMHLGLLYWLLNMLTLPLRKKKISSWAAPLVVMAGLWLFALMAGGGPSILRSAVMFTCIAAGESIQRKTFIYNSLAASAFMLLCINPCWLWDAGFQLSYTAVLSIVIFMQPVYHIVHFDNRIMDHIWKLVAVTLAAQLLTMPVSLYHFHQFPLYFLFTNLLAVPASSCIILLEIGLCLLAPLPLLAKPLGLLLYQLIHGMNGFIAYMETLPFAVWNGLQLNLLQVLALYGGMAGIACWLMKKRAEALHAGLACLLCLCCARTWSFIQAGQQQQLIVYNIPRRQALDIISGRNCFFKGDAFAPSSPVAAARSLYRVRRQLNSLEGLLQETPLLLFQQKKIAVIETALPPPGIQPLAVDIIIISRNAPLRLQELLRFFYCRKLVCDASNTPARVNAWKQEAAKLGLDCFYTVDKGAFVMNLD